jgi:hypothetical protein
MSYRARRAVDEIISDLKGRKGIGDEWEQIDEDIQKEIRDTWQDIIDGYK